MKTTRGTGRVPRVLIAADKFKGSLTAVQVAERVMAGLRRVVPGVSRSRRCPWPTAATGPWTRRSRPGSSGGRCGSPARWATSSPPPFALRDDTAVVEMAEASGLQRLPAGVFAPLTSSTYGSGELLRAALDAGARTIVFGVGGSATTDGGAGMLSALGARFRGRGGGAGGSRRCGAQ